MKANKSETTGRFINLLNDWGFKYIFGKKENLIHFLNEIFQEKEKITDIAYLPTEQFGKTEKERIVVFDVYCKNDRGELILLEMQNIPQAHFYERSLLYSTELIRSQAVKGEWNYELKAVYVIGILNFIPIESANDEQYVDRVSLFNERTKKKFLDILNFIYVILPKFNKRQEELKSQLDDWLYILKHSKELEAQPETIQGEPFDEVFKEIEIKRLTPTNMKAYKYSELKYEDFPRFITDYADMEAEKRVTERVTERITKRVTERVTERVMKKGILEGEKRGILEGKRKISKNLLEMGMSISDISKATGLTLKQIQQLN
jgi:predicted transposase/invertase (TIGR01784 family)